MTAAELRARGNAALGQGRLDEARELYRQAAAADPKDPVPLLNMGFVNVETGRWNEAQENLARAIELARPGEDFLPDAHYLLGRAQYESGERLRALAEYQAAVLARPDFAEPMESAVKILLELKRFEEALQWARQRAKARPGAEGELLVAQVLDLLEQPAEAVAVLDALLAQMPRLATAIEGRGTLRMRMGRTKEALEDFERLVATEGETITRLANIALATHRLGRVDEAKVVARKAIAMGPTTRDDVYNLAAALLEMLEVDEALKLLKPMAKLRPNDATIGWSAGVALLLNGELAEGFPALEHRLFTEKWRNSARSFGRKLWLGRESLEGKSILVFADMGYGDSIQFMRFVPMVAKRAREVFVGLPRALAGLATDLPPNCHLVPEDQTPPATDFECTLMSLPVGLGTTLETIPAKGGYVKAPASIVESWRQRLETLGEGMRVGVVWSGNANHSNDHNRSIPLELFRRIATPGIQLVSLQPEVRAADRAAYDAWTGLAHFGEELKDYTDTAGLVSALDLVITIDSSVSHLAGALSRPTWLLLPHYPDWRWLLDRDDSPWYPTMRLWRQTGPGDWPTVLEAMRSELERVKGIEPSS